MTSRTVIQGDFVKRRSAVQRDFVKSRTVIQGDFVKRRTVIDDFRGARAVKGNVPVAGHVKRVNRGDIFARFCFVRKR